MQFFTADYYHSWWTQISHKSSTVFHVSTNTLLFTSVKVIKGEIHSSWLVILTTGSNPMAPWMNTLCNTYTVNTGVRLFMGKRITAEMHCGIIFGNTGIPMFFCTSLMSCKSQNAMTQQTYVQMYCLHTSALYITFLLQRTSGPKMLFTVQNKAKKPKHLLYYLKRSDMDAITQACIIRIKRNIITPQSFSIAMQITEILFSL